MLGGPPFLTSGDADEILSDSHFVTQDSRIDSTKYLERMELQLTYSNEILSDSHFFTHDRLEKNVWSQMELSRSDDPSVILETPEKKQPLPVH